MLGDRDYVDRANVKSVHGRFARQRGDFEGAADSAREAIGIFEDNEDNHHPLLARAYVHRAFALLLQAQDEGFKPQDSEFDVLRSMAVNDFRTAQAICGHGHLRILDRVHYFRAAWHLYLEEFSHAKSEADLAFRAAEGIADHVIMAHVRILQTQVARKQNAPDDAQRLALEADEYAQRTDNRRVRVRALIWRAMTEADPPRKNYSIAQQLKESAQKGLRSTDRDYLKWEFDDLEAHLKALQDVKNTISLPALTVDEVLIDKSLVRTLNRLAVPICEAVYERTGSILTASHQLGMGRNKFKSICPHLKDQKRTSGPVDQVDQKAKKMRAGAE